MKTAIRLFLVAVLAVHAYAASASVTWVDYSATGNDLPINKTFIPAVADTLSLQCNGFFQAVRGTFPARLTPIRRRPTRLRKRR